MQRIYRLGGLGIGMLAAIGLLGCGNADSLDDVGVLTSQLVASPTFVAMPDTHVGQTSSKLVILTNDQQLPSYITGYTFYPTWSGAYTYSPAMATIQPGGSITTGIFFKPGTVGQQDTRLLIHHHLGTLTQPDLIITITGKGIP
ncbi:MAG TPA: hypothetical protein VH877_02690 [Polyangia bacterium]|jgi:hypothetical protein|nr:hypothetical protein [Polyangia bacterium]